MKDLFDIVEFYESIKQKNLFPNSVFSFDLISQIEAQIKEQNKKFFNLLKEQALCDSIPYRALQIAYNDLDSIYWEMDGKLKNWHIYNIEQTTLFRFEIKYDNKVRNKKNL